jgi:hypothetical protein
VTAPVPPPSKIGNQPIEALVRTAIPSLTDPVVDRVIASLDRAFPDGPAAPRTPPAPVSEAERAAIRQAPIDDVLRAMAASAHGAAGAARLREMLLLGGDAMRGVVLSETIDGRSRSQAALEQRLARPLGLSREELIAVATMLRDRGVAEPLRTAARWSLRGLTPAEAADFLATMGRLQYDPAIRFGFGTHRRQQERRADADAARRQVLDALDSFDGAVPQAAMLRALVAGLASTDRAAGTFLRWAAGDILTDAPGTPGQRTRAMDLVEQWRAYVASVGTGAPSADGFLRYVRMYNRGTQLPRIDEMMGIELAAQPPRPGQPPDALAMGLLPLRVPNDYRPNLPGLDSMGLRPSDGAIVIIDSKAHRASEANGGVISDVSAFFPNLATNMRAAAADLRRDIVAARQAGATIRPDIDAVSARLVAAARAVEVAFPNGIDLSQPGAPARMAAILRRHNIDLVVTVNMVGRPVRAVSARLAAAGVRFLHSNFLRPVREDDE